MRSADIARGHPDYFGLVDTVTSTVTATVPPSKTVLVVSKGDENLLRLGSRSGWHFPRLNDGRYAGYYPADSTDAIEQLEELRKRGADYIVFPATSHWWLDHYPELSDHLETSYACVLRDGTCTIYDLSGDRAAAAATATGVPEMRTLGRDEADPAPPARVDPAQLAAFLDAILPDDAIAAVVSDGDERLVGGGGRRTWHFPRDPSGGYGAHGPPSTGAALDQLEGLRGQGQAFLVIPRDTRWFEHYPGFVAAVEQRYRCVARQRYLCTVYDLATATAPRAAPARGEDGNPRRRRLRGSARTAASGRG